VSVLSAAHRFNATNQPKVRGRSGPIPTKPLKSTGLVRIYQDHRSPQAVLYRRHFKILADAHDLSSPLLRIQAGMVAAAYVSWIEAFLDLSKARAAGNVSFRRIERLRRRQALQAHTYQEALRRFQEMAASTKAPDLAAAFAAYNGRASTVAGAEDRKGR
jgi:hypothetical protein